MVGIQPSDCPALGNSRSVVLVAILFCCEPCSDRLASECRVSGVRGDVAMIVTRVVAAGSHLLGCRLAGLRHRALIP